MNNLIKMRKKLKLRQKDVAKYLDISLKEYRELENTLNFEGINDVIALMTLFKCSFEDIVPTEGTWKANNEKHEIKRIKYEPDISDLVDSKGNITLYKYKPFSEYVMSDIFKNEIIMSYAKDLNDPFETLWGYTINGKDCIAYSKYPGLAIASFSLAPDNPMMWALYGERYKGLCYKIKVNVKSIRENNFLIGRVNYVEEKPMIKVNSHDEIWNTTNTDHFHNLLFTKRKEWESEKEVRVIYEPDHMISFDSIEHLLHTDGKIGKVNNRLHFFNDFEFCEIIVGHLMYESNKIKVESWANQKKIKFTVAQPNFYKANIETDY